MAGPLVTVAVVERPNPDTVDAIERRLLDFNRRKAPALEAERLVAMAAVGDNIFGGAIAFLYGGWAELHVLWVEPAGRGHGVGSRLMAAIEAGAAERGCVGLHTDTFTFQALPFYKSLGYEVFGELDGFEDGNTRYFLRKRF